jgi:hypothetical protein
LSREIAPDGCWGDLKATLPDGLSTMNKGVRRPFDDGALIGLGIGLQFNGLEKVWLAIFCLFPAATHLSYSLKEGFFVQFPHASPHRMGIQPGFPMHAGDPAPSVVSGKTAGIHSSLPLIEVVHGLPMKLSCRVQPSTRAGLTRFVQLFQIVH